MYRFSVVLAGAALAGLVAGGAGSAAVSPAASASPAGPTPTPTPTACPPAVPISATVSAVTATSVTISYSMLLRPPCGYDPPVTVTLFARLEDAQQGQNPVAEAVSGPERYGTMTVDGLAADTAYWVRLSADGVLVPYVLVSVRTAPLPVCAATATIDDAWNGGFVATVAVRNVGGETLDGWRVSWRWPGDERIRALWNAVEEGGGDGVTVRNAPYSGRLAPGASTTFGMLVAAGAPPGDIAVTCGR